MKKILILLIFMIFFFAYSHQCDAYLDYLNDSYGGFWQGIWDGFISFVTLPLSVWFPESIHVYNSNNNGFMYNFGFFIIAIGVSGASIPLLFFAWIIRVVFWIIILTVGMIALFFK